LISLRHSPSANAAKQSLCRDDGVLREILEELRWIDGAPDSLERNRRLRWLGTQQISPNSRFALRRDRNGFLISFVQFGNPLHPMGWTLDRARASSYRALQLRKPSWLTRLRHSVSSVFGVYAPTKQHVTVE
jgi:hypothetical protein